MADRARLEIAGGIVEYQLTPGSSDLAPLVFLHEGLGSIDLWRSFPMALRAALGSPTMLVFDRHGHGRSASSAMPRPTTYMHHEADIVLPRLLAALQIERPLLIGHSDGASIALLFAGGGRRVAGIVAIAPHVFVEDASITGIEAAKTSFETSDLAGRLSRYHDDAHATFGGWNDVWLSDEFRTWNIEECLAGISAPILLIQGIGDEYGTLAQLDAIERGVDGDCDRLVVADAGHAPHLDRPDVVIEAITGFVMAHR